MLWRLARLLIVLTVGCAPKTRTAAVPLSYYLSPTGSDSNSCQQAQSVGTPKATFESAGACLAPGDTLIVRGGTYNQGVRNSIPSGTSWTQTVKVVAARDETVWLKPQTDLGYVVDFSKGQSYIELDGLNVDASNVTYGPVHIESVAQGSVNTHHIRIRNAEIVGSHNKQQQGVLVVHPFAAQGGDEFINLTIHGGGTTDFHHAIYLQAPDVVVDHCTISDWTGAGIQVYNGYGIPPNNITIRNSTIHDLKATASGQRHWGIVVYGAGITNTSLINNVVYNVPSNGTTSVGIDVLAGASLLYHNTLYGGASQGIVIEAGSSGNVVTNNASWGHPAADYADSGAGTTTTTNLFGVDLQVVNAATGDFHLKPTSPAINGGTTLTAVKTDLDGVPRPQEISSDVGAYEYRPVTPEPTPVTITITTVTTVTCSPAGSCTVQTK